MQLRLLLLLCSIIAPFLLVAQPQPSGLFIGKDAPSWVKVFEQPNPNYHEVEQAYRTYYASHVFEKNTYTQFYKRWMRWARPFVQADGTVVVPDVQVQQHREKQLQQQRGENPSKRAASWTFVGPKRTVDIDGKTTVTWQTNIYCVVIAPSDANVLYAGGETGGLWRTNDKGLHWELTTRDILHDAFGAIAVHPSNPQEVVAGTSGKIIKSTDGGKTWNTIYITNNFWVNEMIYHPKNAQIILAATNIGLMRSTNGGSSWVFINNQETWTVKYGWNATPSIYAVSRKNNGAEVLISKDGGNQFSVFNTGFYTTVAGQEVNGAIIATTPADTNRVYAYLCGDGNALNGYIGVWISRDKGNSWANANGTGKIGGPYAMPSHTNLMANNGTNGFTQGFYDMALVVNPNNANELIAGGTSWFKSFDAGVTWQPLGGYVGNLPLSHPDIQWAAAQGNDLWIASDGGLNYSTNFGFSHEARMEGISGADLWGFDSGWNEDILVGGRYHNGNMAFHQSFPEGVFYRMGGAESATGYVNPGPGRKTYFSDIGGYELVPGFGNGARYFSVGAWPNESYAYFANSEMQWHPECYNIVYIGKNNQIWKSLNGGLSFTLLYTFPGNIDNTVFDIEISRANTDVMYCSQWNGVDDAIWRSSNGGKSWTACAPLPSNNNNDRVKMAVSENNPLHLWVGLTYGNNGMKIFKTEDGGNTWINLTTPKLNNLQIGNILLQYGTNGGVYLGTNGGIFYRNTQHTDWQFYGEGLPLSAQTNKLKPFYKEGKIRAGMWGFGVWEAPLFEPSAPVVQATVDKLESFCERDTFYFDDYSVVEHQKASWSWEFPGAAYVAGANERTPRVLFGKPGTYKAIMALSVQGAGVLRDTLTLKVGAGCTMDSLPGFALQLDGLGSHAVAERSMFLNSNTVTMSAWVKPTFFTSDWAGILFVRGGNTVSGLSVLRTGELRYHWNDQNWWFETNQFLKLEEWNHIALVAYPDSMLIYLNGKSVKHEVRLNASAFDAPLTIGIDPNGGDRYYGGMVDEVRVYNRSMTAAEIRRTMHLPGTHIDSTGLVSYYQFNVNQERVNDSRGINHLGLQGNAVYVHSTLAMGPGNSHLESAKAGGQVFGNTGLKAQWDKNALLPEGDVVVTRINWMPDARPGKDSVSRAYWVFRNFGESLLFDPPSTLTLENMGLVPAWAPDSLTLFFREVTQEGNTWKSLGKASRVNAGSDGSAEFSPGEDWITAGQLIVSWPGGLPVSTEPVLAATPYVRAFPNVLSRAQEWQLVTNLEGPMVVDVFNSNGQMVHRASWSNAAKISLQSLVPGTYYYVVQHEKYFFRGKLVIQ